MDARPLNKSFNNHCFEAKNTSDATELAEHNFDSRNCSFDKDLKVTILENVKDSTLAQLERREDYWISTLGTQHCQGLNKRANTELSGIYYCLFG